jgi:hypothetical protein
VTGANSTGAISFDCTKNYKIIISGVNASASQYEWRLITNGTSFSMQTDASESSDGTILDPESTNSYGISADFTLHKLIQRDANHRCCALSGFVTGLYYTRVKGGYFFVGLSSTDNPTTFTVSLESGNWTGKVWLYEIVQ